MDASQIKLQSLPSYSNAVYGGVKVARVKETSQHSETLVNGKILDWHRRQWGIIKIQEKWGKTAWCLY